MAPSTRMRRGTCRCGFIVRSQFFRRACGSEAASGRSRSFDRSCPGRANEQRRSVAVKLPFEGAAGQDLRVGPEGQQLAVSGSSGARPTAVSRRSSTSRAGASLTGRAADCSCGFGQQPARTGRSPEAAFRYANYYDLSSDHTKGAGRCTGVRARGRSHLVWPRCRVR